jgi:hypothetical protein
VSGRGALQVRAASISSNDFRPGVYIEVDGAPYRILGALLEACKCDRAMGLIPSPPHPPAQSTCT